MDFTAGPREISVTRSVPLASVRAISQTTKINRDIYYAKYYGKVKMTMEKKWKGGKKKGGKLH